MTDPRSGKVVSALTALLSLTLILPAGGIAEGSETGEAAEILTVMRPPGPPPEPIPLDHRDPPIRWKPAASSPPPTAIDLFGPSGSARALVGKLKENRRLASEYGSVYQVDGANHLVQVTLDPQNYQDSTGQWRKIDTSLVHGHRPSGPGAGPTDEDPPGEEGYYNAEGPVEVFFPDLLGGETPLSWSMAQGSLSILPLKIADPVKAALDGEWVTYAEVAPGVDLSYTASALGYKETVVLKEPPVGDRITWDITAKSLTLRLEPTGEVSVLAGEDVVATFPGTIVSDSAFDAEKGPATANFDYELADLGDGRYELSVLYDLGFLTDSTRVYPVMIDPSPVLEDFFPAEDTFASSGTGGTEQGSHYNVQAGGGNGAFTYLDFNTDSYERDNRIVYLGELVLQRDPNNGTTSGTVEAKRITPDSWDEGTLNWNNKPGVGTGVFDSANGTNVDGDGWQHWDGLGALYQRWIDPTSPDHYASNKGFRLSNASGSNWHVWCSAEPGSPSANHCDQTVYKPVLYLFYNDPPNAPTASNPPNGTTLTVGTPTLSATAIPSDNNGDEVRLNFQISKSSSNWSGTDLVIASDWIDTSTWVVPAGALKDGQTYYWRIQSGDWCPDIDWVCSNVDADGVTHQWKTSQVRTLIVNLPHYGTDPKWPMWTEGLGNGMSLQVNEATGNLFLTYPVESLATPAGPLTMALTYNSQLAADIGMGPGWNVSAGALSDARKLPTKLTELTEAQGDGVLIEFGDGSQVQYARLGNANSNTFAGTDADGGTVFKNPDTPISWTYTTATGSVYTFNDVGTLLTAMPASKDWAASGTGFTYTFTDIGGAKRLTEIRDPLSRAVTLTWSGTPTRLTSIVTWVPKVGGGGNQTWAIGYDGSNRPFTVTDPVNQVVELTYDPTLGYLSGIQDGQLVASGSTDKTTITYIDEVSPLPDRVSEVKAPPATPGATVYPSKFVYMGVLNGDIVTETRITDPRGTKTASPTDDYETRVEFNTAGLPIRISGPADQNGTWPITRKVWDGNVNLICSRSPEANATPPPDGEKCINPADGNYGNLDDALNTDYDYQTEAPFALLRVTEPDPDLSGPNGRKVTEYKYDEQTPGVAMTGLVDQQFTNDSMSGLPAWKKISGPITADSPDWNWGIHGQPSTLPPTTTNFSLRLSGVITPTSKKTYKFRVRAGGGSLLVVGGAVHSCWVTRAYPNCGDTMDFGVVLKANKPVPITLEYRYVDTDAYAAKLRLEWDQGTGNWQTLPVSMMSPRLGLVTSAIDSAGTTTWSLPDDSSKLRNLPASRSRAGRTTSWVYNDAYGRVTSESVDLSGTPLTTQYVYTDACVTQTTDPAGGVTTSSCNAAGDVTQVKRSVPAVPGTNQSTDQMRVVDTSYDDLGRATHVTVAHPDVPGTYPDTDYVYDSASRLKQTTDPMNFTTDLAYDQAGRLATKSLPSPGGGAPRPVFRYGYDEAGNQNSMVDARAANPTDPNHTWSWLFDSASRVIQETVPAGTDDPPSSTSYNVATNYNVTNRTVTVTTPGGLDSGGAGVTINHVTTGDLLGRVTSEQTGSLSADTFTYDDALHKVTSVVDGVSSYKLHNAFGEVTQETCQGCNSGADATTYYTYDTAGRLKTRVDPLAANASDLNHTWTYGYDAAGRLISSQLPAPLSNTVSFVRDAAGEQVKVTDGAGYVRKYTYDERGRLTSLDNLRGTTSYQYDENDRLTHAFLPSSLPSTQATTLRYVYDNLGRRTQRWGLLAGGQTVNAETFAYDPNGNLTSASTDGGTPSPISVQYDFANRISKVTQGSNVTQYTYAGTQLSSEVDLAGTNNYRYQPGDGLLLTQTPSFGGSTLQYGYDSYGRVLTRNDPQTPTAVTHTVAYDQAGRVKSRQATIGATNLVCFERQFDAVGNVKREAQTQSSACPAATPTWSDYQYDNANRLSQAIEGGTTTNFGYDGAGNRTSVQVVGGATVTTAYDIAGFPDSASDGSDYATDALGELAAVTEVGSTTSYYYDAWGRTNQVVNPAGTFTYAYDALDRTASKTGPGGNSTFAYVGTSQDTVSMSVSGSTFTYDYTRAGPLAQRNGATVRFQLTDLHGDVVGLINPSGQSVGTTTFDAWGQKTASSGTQGYLGYQGDATDSDTSLVDMGARYYLPSLGRFTTEDPLVGDPRDPVTLNRFIYAADSPLTFIDPDGLCIRLEADMPCFNSSDGSGRGRDTSPSPSPSRPSYVDYAEPEWEPRPPKPPNPSKPTPPKGAPFETLVEGYLTGRWSPPDGLGLRYTPEMTQILGQKRAADPYGACSGIGLRSPKACDTHDYGYDLIRVGAFGTDRSAKAKSKAIIDKWFMVDVIAECSSQGGSACAARGEIAYMSVRLFGGGVYREGREDVWPPLPDPLAPAGGGGGGNWW